MSPAAANTVREPKDLIILSFYIHRISNKPFHPPPRRHRRLIKIDSTCAPRLEILGGGLERYKNKRYVSAGLVHTAILITRYKLSFIRVSRILLYHTMPFRRKIYSLTTCQVTINQNCFLSEIINITQ